MQELSKPIFFLLGTRVLSFQCHTLGGHQEDGDKWPGVRCWDERGQVPALLQGRAGIGWGLEPLPSPMACTEPVWLLPAAW